MKRDRDQLWEEAANGREQVVRRGSAASTSADPMSPDHNTHRLNTSQPTSHTSLHTIPGSSLGSVEAILSFDTGVTSRP